MVLTIPVLAHSRTSGPLLLWAQARTSPEITRTRLLEQYETAGGEKVFFKCNRTEL